MKSADIPPDLSVTISSQEGLVEETTQKTSSPSACAAIESITTGDTELSNDLTEIESMQFEGTLESLLSTGIELEAAVIENVAKAKDGGFQVLLSVSEMDAKSVGRLLSDLQVVYNVLLIPRED